MSRTLVPSCSPIYLHLVRQKQSTILTYLDRPWCTWSPKPRFRHHKSVLFTSRCGTTKTLAQRKRDARHALRDTTAQRKKEVLSTKHQTSSHDFRRYSDPHNNTTATEGRPEEKYWMGRSGQVIRQWLDPHEISDFLAAKFGEHGFKVGLNNDVFTFWTPEALTAEDIWNMKGPRWRQERKIEETHVY